MYIKKTAFVEWTMEKEYFVKTKRRRLNEK